MYLEDVYVLEEERGKGHAKQLVNKIVDKAKEMGCYKIICTSRHAKKDVHDMYTKLGWKEHGLEFRIDF